MNIEYRKSRLQTNSLKWALYYVDHTPSTMNDAKKLLQLKEQNPGLVYTGRQTAGRGRIEGRSWFSGMQNNFAGTYILKATYIGKLNAGVIPLILGLGVARLLENEYSIDCRVKWPNDIYANGKKLCGILCERTDGFILAGIGINCNQESFPGELSSKAVSLKMLTHKSIYIHGIARKLTEEIEAVLDEPHWHDEITKRLCWINEKIRICVGNPEKKEYITGVILGVGADGCLIIKPAGGCAKHILSGEIVPL